MSCSHVTPKVGVSCIIDVKEFRPLLSLQAILAQRDHGIGATEVGQGCYTTF